jgi:hypothetical protein
MCMVSLPQDARSREVSQEEGVAFARRHGCLYKETSAKTDTGGVDEGVYDALVWGLVCTIIDTPGLARGREAGGLVGVGCEERTRQRQRGGLLPCC